MAKIRTIVRTCDRCPAGREKPAAETVRFTYEGEITDLDLCPQDAATFHRELRAWARLGRPANDREPTRMFDGRRQADLARAAELRTRQAERDRAADLARIRPTFAPEDPPGVEPLSPAAMSWRISRHAEERMSLRGYTRREVLLAAADPERAVPSKEGPGSFVHTKGEVSVVVHPESKTVLTVLHRDADRYAAELAAQLRRA